MPSFYEQEPGTLNGHLWPCFASLPYTSWCASPANDNCR
jgi:hypothetical protein